MANQLWDTTTEFDAGTYSQTTTRNGAVELAEDSSATANRDFNIVYNQPNDGSMDISWHIKDLDTGTVLHSYTTDGVSSSYGDTVTVDLHAHPNLEFYVSIDQYLDFSGGGTNYVDLYIEEAWTGIDRAGVYDMTGTGSDTGSHYYSAYETIYYSSGSWSSEIRNWDETRVYTDLVVDSTIPAGNAIDVTVSNESGATVTKSLAGGAETLDISSLANSGSVSLSVSLSTDNTQSETPSLNSVAVHAVLRPASSISVAMSKRETSPSWTRVDGQAEGEWEVFESTDGGSTWTKVSDAVAPSTTSQTYAGQLDGERYMYRVDRLDAAGEKVPGPTGAATTPQMHPTAMRVLGVDGDQATVAFRDNSNNKDGYRCYVGPDGYLSFGGLSSGDYVNAPHDPALDITDQITMAVELEPTALDVDSNNNYRVPFGRDHYTPYGFVIEEDGRVNGNVVINGSRQNNNFTTINTDEPVTLVYTVDASTGDFVGYVNGSQAATDTFTTGTIDTSTSPLTISISSGAHQFAGPIYRATLDDRVWSASEVSEWHNGGMVGSPTAHYEMNAGSGSAVKDYSLNGLDGTVKGTPTWVGGGSIAQDNGDLNPQYALEFDATGASTRVTTNDFTLSRQGSTLLFEFIVYNMDPVNDGYGNALFGYAGDNYKRTLRVDVDGYLNGETNTNQEFYLDSNNTPTTIKPGTAYRVALRFDSGTFEVCINGQWGAPRSVSSDLTFNQFGTSAYAKSLDGRLANVARYESALSDPDVSSFMDTGKPPGSPTSSWVVNGRGENSTVPDESGTNDGILEGSVVWSGKPSPVRYTTTNLLDGEQYVARASVYTEHSEVFDQ